MGLIISGPRGGHESCTELAQLLDCAAHGSSFAVVPTSKLVMLPFQTLVPSWWCYHSKPWFQYVEVVVTGPGNGDQSTVPCIGPFGGNGENCDWAVVTVWLKVTLFASGFWWHWWPLLPDLLFRWIKVTKEAQ